MSIRQESSIDVPKILQPRRALPIFYCMLHYMCTQRNIAGVFDRGGIHEGVSTRQEAEDRRIHHDTRVLFMVRFRVLILVLLVKRVCMKAASKLLVVNIWYQNKAETS